MGVVPLDLIPANGLRAMASTEIYIYKAAVSF